MQTRRKVSGEKSPNYFGQIIFRYLPYWPLFLLLFLLAGIGSWLYLRSTAPLYETSARLLIKDAKKGAENAETLESLDRLSAKKIIENEVEVVQSRTLIDEVVRKLHLYAPVMEKQRLRPMAAYGRAPVAVQAKDPDAVRSSGPIAFTFDTRKQALLIDGVAYPVNQWVNTPFGTLRFLPNRQYRETEGEFYFTLQQPRQVTAGIQKNLKVSTAGKLSSILILKLRDEVPGRGEDIMNELLLAYNNSIIKDKNTLAANTLAFVEDRLQGVEQDLDSIERKIQLYKSRTGAVDISTQGKLFLENVSSNDQQLGALNMQLAALNQLEAYVHTKDKASGIVPSTMGVADPMLSQLLDKLYSTELEYESLRKTTAENNPVLLSLTNRIDKMKPSIMENIQSQRRNLIASRNNLAATNNAYTSVLQTIPRKERELIDINRAQSIKSGIYSFLLQKREETALSYASTVPDSRLIDKAQSTLDPVSPNGKIIYLSAFLLAMFSGIGVITARESLSRKIMFRHEIEELTDQPIIGEIAAENTREPIVIGEDNKTFVAEQFRRLRMTLGYLGINSKRKRIMVTSAISGEGKSFVATNLALSLALTGKRVVLLDFDLNNPSLNNKLNVVEHNGITNYLLGECEPEDIILQTHLHPNLFLLPTGDLPRNPSELIMSERVPELLDYLDGLYDYIVIDTAPVGPVTDAYVLSPFCDATLYVIRHKYTPKVFVERIDEDNKITKLTNVAIVFNGVKPRGFGRKEYGYGYGYGYLHKSPDSRKRLRS